MAHGLKKIEPLHAQLIPPQGAEPAGVTDDGKHQLYKLKRKMARGVPRMDPATGERMWRKHGVTGEPLYPLSRPEIYEEELLFYLESDGQGNVVMVDYSFPTPEELAERERRKQVDRMVPALAEALVDEGVTPENVIDALRGIFAPRGDEPGVVLEEAAPVETASEVAPPDETDPPAEEPPEDIGVQLADLDEHEYPRLYGVGLWYLSKSHELACRNGDAKGFKGDRDEAEEQAIAWEQASADADLVPEL